MQPAPGTVVWVEIALAAGRAVPQRARPDPGRIFAVTRSHSFGQLADAIDLALARWDLAQMHTFALADGPEITALEQWDGRPAIRMPAAGQPSAAHRRPGP